MPGSSASATAVTRARVSRGPMIASGDWRRAPSIASSTMKGTPPQWSPWKCVSTMASIVLWSMPSLARATRLVAPKSIANRTPGLSTRKQVLNRPPEPKASPHPTTVTVVVMARRAYAASCSVVGPSPLVVVRRRSRTVFRSS